MAEVETRVVRRSPAATPTLRMTGGKKIFELRPAIDWDKGKALRWLIDAAGLDPDARCRSSSATT